MENKVNFNVLEAIEKIHNKSANSELKPELLEELRLEVDLFSDYLGVDELSAVIFASAIVMGNDNQKLVNVFAHFGENPYLLSLKHRKSIRKLFEQFLFDKSNVPDIKRYKIAGDIEENIACNIPLIPFELRNPKPKKLIDLLSTFRSMWDYFDEEDNSLWEISDQIKEIIKDNQHLAFFQKMDEWNLYDYEVFFLITVLADAVRSGNNKFNTNISETANNFFKNKAKAIDFLEILLDQESNLTILNLIEIKKEKFKEHSTARLSKHLLKFLKETENIQLEYNDDSRTTLIRSEKIKHKNLFYNPSETKQLDTLKEVLSDENFKAVQKKLEEKAMPVGFTILLHGSPGTGKTESVYQIAKETGRTIFKVEISEAKIKWYGESERLVKKIFTDYTELKREEELCPILMFNEADALINKRKSNDQYADKTDNAIQNIFLEELENFDGILMATTNLVENMEKAFERRFLYKVKFNKPGIENSAKIWKDKIPFLTEDESLKLAEKYDFSGGEIENIARKCTMAEILHNANLDFEQISDFCDEERWGDDDKAKIGF